MGKLCQVDTYRMISTEAITQPCITKQQSRVRVSSRNTRYRPYISCNIQVMPFEPREVNTDPQTPQTFMGNRSSVKRETGMGRHYSRSVNWKSDELESSTIQSKSGKTSSYDQLPYGSSKARHCGLSKIRNGQSPNVCSVHILKYYNMKLLEMSPILLPNAYLI